MADPESNLPPPPTVSVKPTARTDLPDNAPWWAKWIVANASEGWKWLSVQLPVLCGFFIEVYVMYGEKIEQYLPADVVPHLAAAAFWITAGLRFINQKKEPK